MPTIAQTNLQLYNQLVRDEWDEPALARVKACYELAARLFTSQFRPCGKPFVDHLVGTASATAHHTQRVDLVGAAVLHAAYAEGVFRDASPGPRPSKRRFVQRAVGPEIEALVLAYTEFAWDQPAIVALLDRTVFDPRTQDLVAMRIANEIDEHLDGATRFSAKVDWTYTPEGIESILCLARRAGLEQLGRDLDDVLVTEAGLDVPPPLRLLRNGSVVMSPLSHMLRPAWTLARLHDRAGLVKQRVTRAVSRSRPDPRSARGIPPDGPTAP